jgi:hypothetical protein
MEAWNDARGADGLDSAKREAVTARLVQQLLNRADSLLDERAYEAVLPPELWDKAPQVFQAAGGYLRSVAFVIDAGLTPAGDFTLAEHFASHMWEATDLLDWLRRRVRRSLAWHEQHGQGEQPPQPPAPEQPPQAPARKKSRDEVRGDLLRLRDAGEAFTTYEDMGPRVGCSSTTVHNVVKETPELQEWVEKPKAGPRAQSMTEVVTDEKTDERAAGPLDNAVINELLKRVRELRPEDKEWLQSQPREVQFEYLNDPDRFPKILGRKA